MVEMVPLVCRVSWALYGEPVEDFIKDYFWYRGEFSGGVAIVLLGISGLIFN